MDHFEFRNLGMDGWQAVLERRLSAASFEPRKTDSEGSIDEEMAQFEVRPGRHDDAAELIDLTYDTYGYSYTSPDFYHPSNLSHRLASGEIVSIVATADGTIVGNTSISYPPETHCCAYLGALMVKRSYRHSKAIELMISETAAHVAQNPNGVDLYYGLLVTAHPYSQIVSAKKGLMPMALLVSAGASVDYRDMQIELGQRETMLLAVLFVNPVETKSLYMPERHHRVLSRAGCTALLSGWTLPPAQKETRILVDTDDVEHHAQIIVRHLGLDWTTQLRRIIFHLTADGMVSISVFLPAGQPLPSETDLEMSKFNAVFSGVKPISASGFFLVYSIFSGRVDFDKIHIL